MSFQKNTQTLAPDDPLWTISSGWKIAQKTGRKYFKLETLQDADLGKKIEAELVNGNVKPIPHEGDYYAPIDRDGQILVYQFTEEDEATNFLDYKPAAGFHPKASNTYKPSAVATAGLQKTGTNSWRANTPPQSTVTTPTTTKPQVQTVTTFTDVEEVELSNKDRIRENERLGLRALPASLVGERVIFVNETGKTVLLMGKIINVQPIQQ